jgi:hypothetical protein
MQIEGRSTNITRGRGKMSEILKAYLAPALVCCYSHTGSVLELQHQLHAL